MRNVMAALAALLVALPAAAQIQVTPYSGNASILTSGGLTTTGDTVAAQVSGSQWATVIWNIVGTAGTALAAVEVSNDGGTNWSLAPFAKRLNLVTSSPTLTQVNGNALVSGDVRETPLAANTTNFRIRCAGSGTTTTVQIASGTPYVPNMPVVALLYDATASAGANNNTGTIDVTGWRQVTVSMIIGSAVTGAASLNIVDDTGAAIAIGTSASIAVGTYAFGWGDSGTFGTANPFTMVGGVTAIPLDRRFNILAAGATTSTIRTRVVARR